MAKWTIGCEWCGKVMSFLTELKKTNWHRCDTCNKKAEKVFLNDCYDEIVKSLENGKWVVGKREITGNMGGIEKDFIVFVFITSKKLVRATRSNESLKDAFDNLFARSWNKEEINQFGFNSLEEIEPVTRLGIGK